MLASPGGAGTEAIEGWQKEGMVPFHWPWGSAPHPNLEFTECPQEWSRHQITLLASGGSSLTWIRKRSEEVQGGPQPTAGTPGTEAAGGVFASTSVAG